MDQNTLNFIILYLKDKFSNGEISLSSMSDDIWDAFIEIKDRGPYLQAVKSYLAKEGISGTDELENFMADFLSNLNLDLAILSDSISSNSSKPDVYDEFLGQAYVEALKASSSDNTQDPIDSIFNGGTFSNWNFEIEYLADIEQDSINAENIKAAAAIFYLYNVDKYLHLFDAVDAITLEWAKGNVSLSGGEGGDMLYTYYKKRDSRLSVEEREWLFDQTLGVESQQQLSGARINKDFFPLFEGLMVECVNYLENSQNFETWPPANLSTETLAQAARAVQHNLSVNTQGKVIKDAHELYAQSEACKMILNQPDIVRQFSLGGEINMWSALENIARKYLNTTINVASARTLAVSGHQVLTALVDFNHDRRDYFNWDTIIKPGETYVISKSQMGNQDGMFRGLGSGSDQIEDVVAEVMDDFNDWD